MWEKKYSVKTLKPKVILSFANQRQLVCSLATTLKTKGKNHHFHFKNAKQKGILEITIFKDSIHLNVHDNRQGDWIKSEIEAWEKWLETQ